MNIVNTPRPPRAVTTAAAKCDVCHLCPLTFTKHHLVVLCYNFWLQKILLIQYRFQYIPPKPTAEGKSQYLSLFVC